MTVILGTAWFMIPGEEWARTGAFAKDQGRKILHASTSRMSSMFPSGAPKR